MAYGNYYSGPFIVIDSSRNLTNVSIAPDVAGGKGLDVGKLGGYSANDFVLKSEIDDNFCQTFCGLDILIKPPSPKIEPSQ